ncbi:MAG: PQQ-binding-like beta-propeller repeat protein [Firmicutes bacterium]|nr:PQQ-binding-like beta-propeller repeat protein [Bacillota bacterium]
MPEAPAPVVYDFNPHAVESTEPSIYIASTKIYVDSVEVESYQMDPVISMTDWESYNQTDGIVTFRGNNFRNGPVVGTVDMPAHQFDDEKCWSSPTTYMETPDGSYWSGNGWTGQPLMRRWTDQEKAGMTSMYSSAKNKSGLVEVIYASLDGYVYFLDLDTGEATRDPLFIGYTFKGAGSLDPRGYPILYVGSGYESGNDGKSYIFIISLLDSSILYQFDGWDYDYEPRDVPYFDGSPLVCAETDQLIYPGENGVIYFFQLHTEYDPVAGTLSVSPDTPVRWSYRTVRDMWLGMEDSCVIYHHYLFVTDNGGTLFCLDLSNLQLVWAQDTLDDTNCTLVLEIEEDGKPYLYTSTSFHSGWRAAEWETAVVPIWKFDAETGEIIWQTDYDCYTVSQLSGGVLGTLAIGKDSLSDYIYVPVSRYPERELGVLSALRKDTGEIAWEYETDYIWTSPVCVYDESGRGYVLCGNSVGTLALLDGLTGEVLDTFDLGTNIEASPAVYENRLVVGTRGMLIWGVTFK